MFLLILPSLVAAGFFSDHVEKYLNTSVEPCDDFYDHVCTSADGRLLKDERMARFKKMMEPYASPEIQKFRERILDDLENLPKGRMLLNEYEAFEQFVGNSLQDCMDDRNIDFLTGVEEYDAYHRLESTIESNFKARKADIEVAFLTIRSDLYENLFYAPWIRKHIDSFEKLRKLRVISMETKALHLDKEVDFMEKRYEECLNISSSVTRSFASICVMYAVCPLRQEIMKNMSYYEASIWKNSGFIDKAFYSPENNAIVLSPTYYTLTNEELPFMIGYLHALLAHGMGNAVFNDEAGPSFSECLRQHMEKTCNSNFGQVSQCNYSINGDEKPVANGNYPRLTEDASDWLGMYGGLRSLKYHFKKILTKKSFPESKRKRTRILQQFFYANAINNCRTNPSESDMRHSPAKARVNGIFSLFPEFSRAFECKRGSNMAKTASCLPFSGFARRSLHGR